MTAGDVLLLKLSGAISLWADNKRTKFNCYMKNDAIILVLECEQKVVAAPRLGALQGVI